MIIQEQVLERLMQCPLLVPTSPSKAETCANALTTWTLRQAFENKFLGKAEDILHNIRGKVLELWGESSIEAGTLSRTVAFRLFNLATDYEVVHIEQPYNLILSGYTIQGKYALLRKRKGECLPYVLVTHATEPELRHKQILPPDVTTLARFVHARTNGAYTDVQVMHYPMFKGKLWLNKTIDMSLATLYLESMLKVAALRPQYPVMGEHCVSCSTKPCLEVFEWTK